MKMVSGYRKASRIECLICLFKRRIPIRMRVLCLIQVLAG
jgi:hypothetical protein